MRISTIEHAAIQVAAAELLPAGFRVALFGSRTDDKRRGGDLDLLIEPPVAMDPQAVVEMRTRLAARLYRVLGERRIDIIVTQGVADDRLIVAEARRQAIALVHT